MTGSVSDQKRSFKGPGLEDNGRDGIQVQLRSQETIEKIVVFAVEQYNAECSTGCSESPDDLNHEHDAEETNYGPASVWFQ